MATTAVYGDRVKIADSQSLQLSTPPGFTQNWKYGKNSNGETIFEYINPDAPKMTMGYNSKNQLVEVPDIGWDGKPWTNKTWLDSLSSPIFRLPLQPKQMELSQTLALLRVGRIYLFVTQEQM